MVNTSYTRGLGRRTSFSDTLAQKGLHSSRDSVTPITWPTYSVVKHKTNNWNYLTWNQLHGRQISIHATTNTQVQDHKQITKLKLAAHSKNTQIHANSPLSENTFKNYHLAGNQQRRQLIARKTINRWKCKYSVDYELKSTTFSDYLHLTCVESQHMNAWMNDTCSVCRRLCWPGSSVTWLTADCQLESIAKVCSSSACSV